MVKKKSSLTLLCGRPPGDGAKRKGFSDLALQQPATHLQGWRAFFMSAWNFFRPGQLPCIASACHGVREGESPSSPQGRRALFNVMERFATSVVRPAVTLLPVTNSGVRHFPPEGGGLLTEPYHLFHVFSDGRRVPLGYLLDALQGPSSERVAGFYASALKRPWASCLVSPDYRLRLSLGLTAETHRLGQGRAGG